MSSAHLVDDLISRIGASAVSTDEADRWAMSRDYAWLSPVLTDRLPDRPADVVARLRSADDAAPVLDAAYRHRVPVTPRGRGTGNYGQAVPLEAGLVVDLTGCSQVLDIDAAGGIAHVEAGISFSALEAAANQHGLEVPVMPSTVHSTLGGFLSGGNQGVGSIEHGSIWDGWVDALTIVPCRDGAEATLVEGPTVRDHLHAYGTAGLISTVRIRLAPCRARTALSAAFTSFADAARAGRGLMDLDPVPRVVAVDDPGIVATFPARRGRPDGFVALRAAVDISTLPEAQALVTDHGARAVDADVRGLPTLVASVYNHATLRAKRADPRTCALQIRGWAVIDHEDEVRAALPDVRLHLDGNAPRRYGKGYSGLLLSTWRDGATLDAGIERLEALGLQVISPHSWTLGRHDRLDRIRAVARSVDPAGLLNPGRFPEPADPGAADPAPARSTTGASSPAIDHVALEVADIEARVATLVGHLGMEVRREGKLSSDPSRRVVLLGDGTAFKLELVESADGADRLAHIAWRVDDVARAHDALVAAGWRSQRAPSRLAAARADTANVVEPGGLLVQLVRYDADSPDR